MRVDIGSEALGIGGEIQVDGMYVPAQAAFCCCLPPPVDKTGGLGRRA